MILQDCVYLRIVGEDYFCKKYGEHMNYEVACGRCKCSEVTRTGQLPICQKIDPRIWWMI